MARSDRRVNALEVTDGYPDPGDNSTLAPRHVGDERRLNVRRVSDKLGDLSLNLSSNAQWIKDFLRPRG